MPTVITKVSKNYPDLFELISLSIWEDFIGDGAVSANQLVLKGNVFQLNWYGGDDRQIFGGPTWYTRNGYHYVPFSFVFNNSSPEIQQQMIFHFDLLDHSF